MIIFKESWIQHATVKENILFGKEFDRSKYKAVLKACALEEVRNTMQSVPEEMSLQQNVCDITMHHEKASFI